MVTDAFAPTGLPLDRPEGGRAAVGLAPRRISARPLVPEGNERVDQSASTVMNGPLPIHDRVTVDGKSFFLGGKKFFAKGVTYGPFPPNPQGEFFPSRESATRDLAMVLELGANVLRVYHPPPRWFLDLCHEHGIKVLVDVPWNKHLCFLDHPEAQETARAAIRAAARSCAAHPAVFAISVVNEVPADIVRWSGGAEVAEFIEELIDVAKEEDPACLCTFGNFPTTEFLRPRNADFHCWNLYLHHRRPFENYLARLQMLADTKPLVLGEFGLDTLREGPDRQAEALGWMIESAYRAGCAGTVLYSFTDEWYKDGRLVADWKFGLTTVNRERKPAWEVVRRQYHISPYFPLRQTPRVSVVVATYNGAATLKLCLQSLESLNYPDYEVIVVDDGSTDATEQIVGLFPKTRVFRHASNQGLSVARNTGIYAATGEIIAFTDSDCRADQDWLYYLVSDLLTSGYAGIGGHNFLPADDSPVAASVMVSPGGPAHVMLTDRLAEHIPGCNMAFYKWALMEVGGFDPVFRKAGDDVDICWRLQQKGYRIGFSPAGFVWHYRRNTIQAYLKQQAGYGDAEALLERRHPENFNRFGGSIWHGRIYSPARMGVTIGRPVIYHGLFASGFFQSIYNVSPGLTLMVVTSIEYYALVSLPLLVVGAVVPHLTAFGMVSIAISLAMCTAAAVQAELPRGNRRFWSRPLVALLFWLQPIVRGIARHRGHLRGQQTRLSERETLESVSLEDDGSDLGQLVYWNEVGNIDRIGFLARVIERLDQRGWPNKPDSGWTRHDLEVYGSRWARLLLTTASEYHVGGRQLLRCRLESRWSFMARALFWSTAGTILVAIGAIGQWWAWLALTVLPFLAWWLNTQKLDLQRVFATFLDGCSKEFEMVKITEPRPRNGWKRGQKK
jgi:O-antigen biosynthesis protein